MNEIKLDFDSTQDCGPTQDCGNRETTRLEKCVYSLVDINTRIDYLNSQHYKLLNKLDVSFVDDEVCKNIEPEVSTGLLRDIESIINKITNKINISEKNLELLEKII